MDFITNDLGWIFESQKDKVKMLTLDEVKKIIGESIVEQQGFIKKEFPAKLTFAEALDLANSLPREGSKENNEDLLNYGSQFGWGPGKREGLHFPLPNMYSFDLTLDVKCRPGKTYPYGPRANYHASFEDELAQRKRGERIRLGNRYRGFRTYEQGIKGETPVTLDVICSEFYENTYLPYYASCLNSIATDKVI